MPWGARMHTRPIVVIERGCYRHYGYAPPFTGFAYQSTECVGDVLPVHSVAWRHGVLGFVGTFAGVSRIGGATEALK